MFISKTKHKKTEQKAKYVFLTNRGEGVKAVFRAGIRYTNKMEILKVKTVIPCGIKGYIHCQLSQLNEMMYVQIHSTVCNECKDQFRQKV